MSAVRRADPEPAVAEVLEGELERRAGDPGQRRAIVQEVVEMRVLGDVAQLRAQASRGRLRRRGTYAVVVPARRRTLAQTRSPSI